MSEVVDPIKSANDFFNGKGEIIITPNGPVRDNGEDPNPEPQPQPNPEPQPEPQPQPEPNPEPQPEPAIPSFDFSKFGVQSEEELSARISRLSELESKAKEFEAFNEIKSKINAPYADESIAKVNAVVRETGIKNLSIASDIATLTPEQLRSDPAKALAFREILKNPEALSALSFGEIKQAMEKRYELEEGEELSPLTKLEVETAIKEVQNKVDSISTSGNDVIANLLKEREQQAFLFQQKSEKAAKDVEVAVSKFSTLNAKFGSEEISVAVSPELLSQVKGWATQFASNLPDGDNYQSSIDAYISATLESAMKDKIAEKFREKIEGKIRQEAVRTTHNGGPVTHKDKPSSGDEKWIPEWQQAHIDYAKKMGVTLPNS